MNISYLSWRLLLPRKIRICVDSANHDLNLYCLTLQPSQVIKLTYFVKFYIITRKHRTIYIYIYICYKTNSSGSLNPIFKPLFLFIEPVTTKLLVYEFGAFSRIWSDESAIVVVLVPPDDA